MSLPTEMINRWQDRAEPAPCEGLLYWHILVGDHPEAVAIARGAQTRLAPVGGLHMTPLKRQHMTAMIAGPADEISSDQIEQMAKTAERLLADTPPITVRLGKIVYHPEAIMLEARPGEALVPVLEAARRATQEVTGSFGRSAHQSQRWTPHITVCYSESRQPAGPIIAALGHEVPGSSIQISAVSIVIQQGPERRWDWHPAATVHFAANT